MRPFAAALRWIFERRLRSPVPAIEIHARSGKSSAIANVVRDRAIALRPIVHVWQ